MGAERYWAFISYSHRDARAAAWLQRAIETYRPPSRLSAGNASPVPRRLTPIFRDREDLPAAGNLSDAIRAALGDSRFLIVVCSPDAAASRWVEEEVRYFKSLHGETRALALIVDGTPFASDDPARAAEECFPPSLRVAIGADGAPTQTRVEPLAADLRSSADGRRLARLKIVAGMLGVRLDALIQRDAARRTARQRLTVGASMALAGALGVLTWRAELARRDADFQRDQAEDLIEFMLTDLRDRLEPVGRLDVLEAVGSRALGYYARQRIETLDAESLSRRATALMLLGKIDQRRGDLEAAEVSFAAALATTAEQLRRDPANAQRIFDHAQAVFYVGDVAGDRGDLAVAEARWLEYYDLALRLASIDPEKPEWQLEVAFATSNLGALKQRAGAFDEAAAFFADSATTRRALSEADPGSSALAKSYAYALSWLTLAELSRGSFRRAIDVLNEQIAIYDRLLAASPEDYSIFRVLVTAQRRLAEAYLCLGDVVAAKTAVAAAREMIDDLLARDDSVSEWRAGATYLAVYDALFLRLAGDAAGADAALIHAVRYSDVVVFGQEPNRLTRNAIGYALAERLRYIDPDDPDARVIARRLLEFIETSERDAASRGGDDDDAPLIASWWVALSWFADATGERAQALAHARRGLDALAGRAGKLSVKERMTLAELLFAICDAGAASAVMDELAKLGLAHPSFVELRKRAIQTQCLQSAE